MLKSTLVKNNSGYVVSVTTLLLAGTLILITSLYMASKQQVVAEVLASDTIPRVTQQEVYSGQVLPDHVAYPVIAAIDHMRLQVSDQPEQLTLQLELADRRKHYAQQLALKNKPDLAVVTLGKSHHLLVTAADAVVVLPPTSDRQKLRQAIQKQRSAYLAIQQDLPLTHQPAVAELILELDAYLDRI